MPDFILNAGEKEKNKASLAPALNGAHPTR